MHLDPLSKFCTIRHSLPVENYAQLGSYAFVLAEAERRNNRKAVKELRAIGVPPHTVKKLWVERTWLPRRAEVSALNPEWNTSMCWARHRRDSSGSRNPDTSRSWMNRPSSMRRWRKWPGPSWGE